jgi:hypothetical protein
MVILSGCGLHVPEMQELYADKEEEKFDENDIVNAIKCELRKGVRDVLEDPMYSPTTGTTGNQVDWLRQWGTKVSLQLSVSENGAFNPGVTFTTPFQTSSQSFSLGLGVQSSAEALRKETIGFSYAFSELLNEPKIDFPCTDPHRILIHSNLKIGDFIKAKAFIARVPGTIPTNTTAGPFSAFSYEVQFTVEYGGSITPSWKLVRLSTNTNSPLLSAKRKKIQNMTLTLGPMAESSSQSAADVIKRTGAGIQLAPDAEAVHNANLIGQAIVSSIRSLQIQ